VLIAQVRDGDPLDEVPLDDRDLLNAEEPLALLGYGVENPRERMC